MLVIQLLRSETDIRKMLDSLLKFRDEDGFLIDEMHGEIYALEYVLEMRDDLF